MNAGLSWPLSSGGIPWSQGHRRCYVILFILTSLMGLPLQANQPRANLRAFSEKTGIGAHLHGHHGHDNEKAAGRSEMEGRDVLFDEGEEEEEEERHRGRRDTAGFDWPAFMAEHNKLRAQEGASNMELMVSSHNIYIYIYIYGKA